MGLFMTQCLSVQCAKNMINCKVSQLFILWNHNEQRRAKIIVANKAQFCPGYLQIIPPINVHFWINLSTWTFLAWLKTSRSKNVPSAGAKYLHFLGLKLVFFSFLACKAKIKIRSGSWVQIPARACPFLNQFANLEISCIIQNSKKQKFAQFWSKNFTFLEFNELICTLTEEV